MTGTTLLLAQAAPARGTPIEDLIPATIVAAILGLLLAELGLRFKRGSVKPLRQVSGFAAETVGLPKWAALPGAITTVSLIVAVFGFYWDVSTHIDNGRDPGPFANPSHYFILFGLAGIAVAGYLALLVGSEEGSRASFSLGSWKMPLGAALIFLCGVVALFGFPLDDVWHRLFGQDVTLWGPTHIQMVAGASLATLAILVLLSEAGRTHGNKSLLALRQATAYGAFLIGLSTLQGEFDFGVPQFRLLYEPILIMLAAGIGLVTARVRLGRGGAIKAALFFILVRGALALLVGPVLGRITPHFPLYLAEAIVVELVALRVSTDKQLTFGIAAGAGIGTFGLAAEWAWSHLWMPNPWPAALLPEGAIFGLLAALSGGIIGGAIGRALASEGAPRQHFPGIALAAAVAGVLACLIYPAPMGGLPGTKAHVTLDPASGGRAYLNVRVEPADAADDALWFQALSWQGLEWERGSSPLVDLEPTGEGTYRSAEPLPVSGPWKSIIRLHVDNDVVAVPVYLPADPAIPAKEVPAEQTFTRPFVPDKEILQREAITDSVGLQRAAYVALIAIGLAWIAAFAFALRRLDRVSQNAETRTRMSERWQAEVDQLSA